MAELQASGARCKFLALCQLLRICFLETATLLPQVFNNAEHYDYLEALGFK